MRKKILVYLLITILTFFLMSLSSCDSRIGKPDIRKEFKNEENKPDYFGWRFDFKW